MNDTFENTRTLTIGEPPSKKARRGIIVLLVSVLLISLGVIAGVLFLDGNGVLGKDSGIAACEQMAANAKDNKSTGSNAKMTEAQYKEKKAPFENSRHADIKVAGMNIVDTVYKADTMGDDTDLGEALTLMATVQSQWAQLQVACGNHGVEIPPLNLTPAS